MPKNPFVETFSPQKQEEFPPKFWKSLVMSAPFWLILTALMVVEINLILNRWYWTAGIIGTVLVLTIAVTGFLKGFTHFIDNYDNDVDEEEDKVSYKPRSLTLADVVISSAFFYLEEALPLTQEKMKLFWLRRRVWIILGAAAGVVIEYRYGGVITPHLLRHYLMTPFLIACAIVITPFIVAFIEAKRSEQ